MSPDEARRAATVQFGGVESTKDRAREQVPARASSKTRYATNATAFVTLRRTPGFTLVSTLTLALTAYGATTAVFSGDQSRAAEAACRIQKSESLVNDPTARPLVLKASAWRPRRW